MRIPWPAWFGSLGIHLAILLALGLTAWVLWPAAEPKREPPQLALLPARVSASTTELPPMLEPVDAVPPEAVDAELQEAPVDWDQFRESVPSPVAQWPVRAEWLNDPSAYARPRRTTAEQQAQPDLAPVESVVTPPSTPPTPPEAQREAPAPQAEQPPVAGASDPEPRDQACPAPTYPLVARRRGMEGVVVLLVEVSSSGAVLRSRVLESSGHGVLDRAALDGVEVWRFTPARDSAGLAVAGSARVPIRFRIGEAGGK